MQHQSLYRAYRPQTFGEMSGQKYVKQTLQNALAHDRTTHAYLFSGPRGTGKTSAAKIFAKALNCERGPAAEPCNECDTCVSITEGSHTDVIEFDAASNSRVEEIRDIIEKVRFAPASSKYKVYIIDEVHMLSNSAFNALLKTLEEPPSHVVFILATTEQHKLPLTIISRCQRFEFKPLAREELVDRMRVVLEAIGGEAEERALTIIAQAASGGMRDALSMLDQAVAFSASTITEEDALLVTGIIGETMFYTLAEAIIDQDAGAALQTIERLISEGKDELRLVEDSITFFRDLLLLKTAPQAEQLLELITDVSLFEPLLEKVTVDRLYTYIEVLAEAQQNMRFSSHARVYIESAILKMIHTDRAPVTEPMQQLPDNIAQKIVHLQETVQQLERQLSSEGRPEVQEKQPKRPVSRPNQKEVKVPRAKIEQVLEHATRPQLETLKQQWAAIMGRLTTSHAALLGETEPVAASDEGFVLKFKYDIHCSMAMDRKELNVELSSVLNELMGKTYEAVFVPSDAWFTIRTEFIRQNKLTKRRPGEQPKPIAEAEREPVVEEVPAFSTEVQESAAHIEQARQLFGDLVTVKDD